jgi:hypothetical protein
MKSGGKKKFQKKNKKKSKKKNSLPVFSFGDRVCEKRRYVGSDTQKKKLIFHGLYEFVVFFF